jgi:hypothetical protein
LYKSPQPPLDWNTPTDGIGRQVRDGSVAIDDGRQVRNGSVAIGEGRQVRDVTVAIEKDILILRVLTPHPHNLSNTLHNRHICIMTKLL